MASGGRETNLGCLGQIIVAKHSGNMIQYETKGGEFVAGHGFGDLWNEPKQGGDSGGDARAPKEGVA